MINVGDLLEGKYEILRQIGKGGMSTVYLAMDTHLNKQWAVKELRKVGRDSNNEIVIQSAIAEANLIKKLDHPSLPRIVDIIDKKDVICIVMDYIEGQSLDFVLKEYGPQSQEDVIGWGKQLCDVLGYLHSQNPPIIYRDMKPGNVMLKPDGRVTIIDFGIAREYKATNSEDTVALGTRGYAAPEQYKDARKQTDARTDIYCLGVTLHHLVTGVNPNDDFSLAPIRTLNATLSGGLENIIIKCTQKNPEDRYQSCEELMVALNHYEEEDDIYKYKSKKMIHNFLISSIACGACVVLGIGSLLINSGQIKSDYTNLVSAGLTTSGKDARSSFIQAINMIPKNKEAYIGLIDEYKDDLSFTQDESTELNEKVISALTSKMKTQNEDGFYDVSFELGKLYWYYYDYGDNAEDDINITNMNASSKWFKEVTDGEYAGTAHLYYSVGTFYNDIQKKRNEGSKIDNMYKEYFKNLRDLFDNIQNSDESDIVKLEIDRLIVNSLEGYVRDFAKDGVSKEDLLKLYSDAVDNAQKINPETDKLISMRNDVIDRDLSRKENIDKGYIEK